MSITLGEEDPNLYSYRKKKIIGINSSSESGVKSGIQIPPRHKVRSLSSEKEVVMEMKKLAFHEREN